MKKKKKKAARAAMCCLFDRLTEKWVIDPDQLDWPQMQRQMQQIIVDRHKKLSIAHKEFRMFQDAQRIIEQKRKTNETKILELMEEFKDDSEMMQHLAKMLMSA